MTQFINPKPVAAMSSMGARPDPYTQGMGGVLSLADGGFIGGGTIQGQAMPGGRTGYGNPFKKIFKSGKKAIKKLVPKELAGIMQVAAPFMAPTIGPWGAAALSGLGQYKSKGKINPLQLAMSVAPGIKNAQISKLTGGRWNPTDIKGQDNFLRTLMGKVPGYDAVDTKMFGEVIGDGMQASDITEGWMGSGGKYGGIGELLSKGTDFIIASLRTCFLQKSKLLFFTYSLSATSGKA